MRTMAEYRDGLRSVNGLRSILSMQGKRSTTYISAKPPADSATKWVESGRHSLLFRLIRTKTRGGLRSTRRADYELGEVRRMCLVIFVEAASLSERIGCIGENKTNGTFTMSDEVA